MSGRMSIFDDLELTKELLEFFALIDKNYKHLVLLEKFVDESLLSWRKRLDNKENELISKLFLKLNKDIAKILFSLPSEKYIMLSFPLGKSFFKPVLFDIVEITEKS